MLDFKYIGLITILFFSCNSLKKDLDSSFANKYLERSEKQFSLLLKSADSINRIPRTITPNDKIHWTNESFDWTEGFFPGSCWYLYEFSKDKSWKKAAEKFQSLFESHKYYTNNHDLGFVFNCSYGNGYRLTGNEDFKEIMVTAANSLLTRYNPVIGCIQSWDTNTGWQAKRGWEYPVIIDNMMNLELLFEVSSITGDEKYKNAAISHADTTLKNHFREDNSSYHLVDYDLETGNVRSKQTAQGYSDESSWARGQAWGLYGYTVCYRYTENKKYLDQALNIANYITNTSKIPDDGIPYWDYDAPNIPNEPRDVSAAAITVSALLELDDYTELSYGSYINKILTSLSSEKYFAELGGNNFFLLKHSVGSIPHGAEINVPLNYADYYYLEALVRLRRKK